MTWPKIDWTIFFTLFLPFRSLLFISAFVCLAFDEFGVPEPRHFLSNAIIVVQSWCYLSFVRRVVVHCVSVAIIVRRSIAGNWCVVVDRLKSMPLINNVIFYQCFLFFGYMLLLFKNGWRRSWQRQCGMNDDDEIQYRQAVIKMFNYIFDSRRDTNQSPTTRPSFPFVHSLISLLREHWLSSRVHTYANHILYQVITYLLLLCGPCLCITAYATWSVKAQIWNGLNFPVRNSICSHYIVDCVRTSGGKIWS